ncbi:Mobile element protein [Rubellimicrobium mesophilum DSM 19309]|uniref:Mobile element protein n=1 Tax=Rubellimicrobium mesophilum DSM 19309 TaxID=442562 RepID=A0A017HUY8_9RHOB|nr:Mobile element protein [Rubellimicrobium mesophilum DSM 19309]
MRYTACTKAEIIWLVEQSHLPVGRNLEKLGIPRATFERWVKQVVALVEHDSHARLKNLTPADVYHGEGEAILAERERIKKHTFTHQRLQHHATTA